MRATNNTTKWMKIGQVENISFMGPDIICYAMSCCITFINVNTFEKSQLTANYHNVNGDGVALVRGHRSIYTFAYAENTAPAALCIKNYPNFETVATFSDGPPEGYSNMTFSETSLLITIGGLPNFTITVWDWRKGEKIGEFKNKLSLENQFLRCSWSKPIYMSQMVRHTNYLYIWDIFTCCRRALMKTHWIFPPNKPNLSPYSDILWSTDGGMFVSDMKGCIYALNDEAGLDEVITADLEGDILPSICWFKGGIVILGPNQELRHYKKTGDWVNDWTLPLDVKVKNLFGNRSDYLIGVTFDEEIVKINNTGKEVVYLKQYDTKFDDFCLIYPTGEHIIALRHQTFLTVYETISGKLVTNLELKRKAKTITENPEFPYVAVGYIDGVLELISVYNPEKLSVMASFNLTSNPISRVQFFEHGRVIVTGFQDIGEFFLIEGLPGTEMKIITNINLNCQIVDYMLVASKHCYRLFFLPVTSKFLAGNKIIRYCIISKDNMNVKEYTMEDENTLYFRILPTTDTNRDRLFYLLPFKSKDIHLLETKRGDPLAKVVSVVKTGHLLRKINFLLTKQHAVTWGYDGFVIARDKNFEKEVGMSLIHHRYGGGVKKAYIDPLGKYIISLGRENVLGCVEIVANKIDEDLNNKLQELKTSVKYAVMFKRPTIGFVPEERFQDKNWLEVKRGIEIEKEKEICAEEKGDIQKEFIEIQSGLVDLVTKNIIGPENEKLDMLEFYLDTALYNKKKDMNREHCKKTEIYLKALIVAQDLVSDHLIKTYWDPMEVNSKVIFGIFANTVLINYTLLPVDAVSLRRSVWIAEQRKIQQFLSRDQFEPWLQISEEELREKFSQTAKEETEDYGTLANQQQWNIADPMSQLSFATQIALAGTIAQVYIERSLGHYMQNQIVTYYQTTLEQNLSETDAVNLKKHFNNLFEDVMIQKKREMSITKERNARLRVIISETNYFSEKKINLNITDPEWEQLEEPEMIRKVFDYELSITPYISPSEQAILDAKAAEAERIRLALLADDFKERALMAMMNGVLEIRWEDELKKDVPIPKCMVEKDPAKFNEEDLRAVRDYEEAVAFLHSERERYKNLLDLEFTKITTSMRESIRKFNNKLKDAVEYKMQIDSALNQDNLKINRIWLHQSYRCSLLKKDTEIVGKIKHVESALQKLYKLIPTLNEELNYCRNNFELGESKERMLEKAFKKDLHSVSPIVQEQAVKLYKKRPKVVIRQMPDAVLLEVARCLMTREQSLILTSDCKDFIKAVDQIDQFVGVPPTIDENTYNIICKHRRLRIEFEIKQRAFQYQVTDGEATVSTYQKRVTKNKEKLAKFTAELECVRKQYVNLIHNIQTQMVLRRGLVELQLQGDLRDFEDAILVPKREVVKINKLIVEAGTKKLDVIMKNMAFRRNIMAIEWEHKRLRMIINDLIEQLKDIESVQLTKEMQHYLKAKKLGRKTDVMNFETEVEIIAASFENRIKDQKEKYGNIRKQIHNYKAQNAELDQAISDMNIDVCFLNLQKDKEVEAHHSRALQTRMDTLLKRNSLIQQIQKNHNEILVLQTELELLRLRTYPTFKYKLI